MKVFPFESIFKLKTFTIDIPSMLFVYFIFISRFLLLNIFIFICICLFINYLISWHLIAKSFGYIVANMFNGRRRKLVIKEKSTKHWLVLVYGVKCHFQQYFSYIVVVSFIGGGIGSTRENQRPCCKSLTNFIT